MNNFDRFLIFITKTLRMKHEENIAIELDTVNFQLRNHQQRVKMANERELNKTELQTKLEEEKF